METPARAKTNAAGIVHRPRSPVNPISEKYPPLDTSEFDCDPEFVADFLKAQFVEDVLKAMEAQGLNKNTLAAKLGKKRQYVGQILNETANFTIKTMAEISCALGRQLSIRTHGHNEELVIQSRKQTPVKSARGIVRSKRTRRLE